MWNGQYIGRRAVAAVYGHGDLVSANSIMPPVTGPGRGVTRVGACLVSKDYFASGTYEVDVKFWPPWVGTAPRPSSVAPSGSVFCVWTFAWQKHDAASGDTTGDRLNPADLQYQPSKKQGTPGGHYSTVNSEIDAPEFGSQGSFTNAKFNTWQTETVSDVKSLKVPVNVMDGRYHRFSFVWETEAILLPNLKDSQVTLQNGNYRINVLGVYPEYQGAAIAKGTDGKYYAKVGKKVSFFVDGNLVRESSICSPVAARLVIGCWFPTWAGPAAWDFCKFTVARVSVSPSNSPGDVYNERETVVTPTAPVPLRPVPSVSHAVDASLIEAEQSRPAMGAFLADQSVLWSQSMTASRMGAALHVEDQQFMGAQAEDVPPHELHEESGDYVVEGYSLGGLSLDSERSLQGAQPDVQPYEGKYHVQAPEERMYELQGEADQELQIALGQSYFEGHHRMPEEPGHLTAAGLSADDAVDAEYLDSRMGDALEQEFERQK
jgi:hypothetical protein